MTLPDLTYIGVNTPLTQTDYFGDEGIRGDSTSTAVYVVGAANFNSAVSALMWATDPLISTLVCIKIKHEALNGDTQCGVLKLTCSFAPIFSVEAWQVGKPWKARWEGHQEAIVVSGQLTWPDNTVLTNQNAQPDQRFAIRRVVLFGTRAAADSTDAPMQFSGQSTIDGLCDCVNSDSFLGYDAGQVKLNRYSAEPKQLFDGSIVFAVQIELEIRSISWNLYYRENAASGDDPWQQVSDPSGNPIYSPQSFSALLSI